MVLLLMQQFTHPTLGSGSDERNYHAHVMFTTRAINKNGTFEAKNIVISVVIMGQKVTNGVKILPISECTT
jgi:hypothetical protein